MKRIVSTVAITLASGALVVGSGSSFSSATATATGPSEPEVTSTAVVEESTTVAPRRRRWISIRAFNRGRQAYVRGHVGPKNRYKRRLVIIQSKPCRKCRWKFHGKTRTSGKSNYQRKIRLPRNGKRYFFRARLPKSKVHSKTLKVWWT